MAYNSKTYRRNVRLESYTWDYRNPGATPKGRSFNVRKLPESEVKCGCGSECWMCLSGKGPKRMFFSKPRRREGKKLINEQLEDLNMS